MTDSDQQPPTPPPAVSDGGNGSGVIKDGSNRYSIPSEATLQREQDVLRLRRARVSWTDIALQLGCDKPNAIRSYKRALKRNTAPLVAELRELEAGSLDDLQAAVWRKAMGGNLEASRTVVRIMERRAKLFGLDHADGIAERLVQLEADKVRLMAVALGAALSDLGLTDDQAAHAKRTMIAKLRELNAIDADATDSGTVEGEVLEEHDDDSDQERPA